jgi:hypothetical protein
MPFVTIVVTNLKVKYFPLGAEIQVLFPTFALAVRPATVEMLQCPFRSDVTA